MSTSKTSSKSKKIKYNEKYPFVSVITPTYNRRPFIETMFQIFRNQTYPKDRIEWIIVDDGTDKIADLIEKSNIPQIKYYSLPEKITLGTKRNLCHSYTTGDENSILVYQDDDDWYSPERISHAVETLQKNPQALCVGSSEIYIYFKHIHKMYQAGPYSPTHATAGTFAFRKKLLKEHRYEDTACLAEEKAFLKNYTVPFAQLDPMKTILVFSHIHNTFDKKKLLENPHPLFFRESPKTVDMFLNSDVDKPLKQFFMNDIDKLLENYKPGDPSMKPDVLVQIKEIEKERARLMAEAQSKQASEQGAIPQIVMQREGQPPVTMSLEQAVNLLSTQHRTIDELIQRNKQFKDRVDFLERKIYDMETTMKKSVSVPNQSEIEIKKTKKNKNKKNDNDNNNENENENIKQKPVNDSTVKSCNNISNISSYNTVSSLQSIPIQLNDMIKIQR